MGDLLFYHMHLELFYEMIYAVGWHTTFYQVSLKCKSNINTYFGQEVFKFTDSEFNNKRRDVQTLVMGHTYFLIYWFSDYVLNIL
jgi:hypothetical protein